MITQHILAAAAVSPKGGAETGRDENVSGFEQVPNRNESECLQRGCARPCKKGAS